MFLFVKNFTLLPITLLCWLGEPFRYELDTSYRNFSRKDIKRKYNNAWHVHYDLRIFISCVTITFVFAFLFGAWLSSGYLLLVFPLIAAILFVVDLCMIFARYTYHVETQKEAEEEGSLSLVPIDHWKDTSVQSLLLKRKRDIEEFEANKHVDRR